MEIIFSKVKAMNQCMNRVALETISFFELTQIEEKQYEAVLVAKGVAAERIRKLGFAFEGKRVLIGSLS